MHQEAKVDTKQVSGLYKKWEGNPFLEQEKSILQWDMLTSQIQLNMERNISNYLRLCSCNFPYSEYKSLTHRGNCTKYKLCNDVEENPGPAMHHVDPNKTIKEPYKKGDVVVFGQNAGQKCVAMSLCALIYHNMKGISNPGDLKQIVHIGNQL